jgi:Protein of unknown function (DUF2800)
MSSPTLHSKLPPSGAERWMTCPGSVVLSDGMPGEDSEYAAEGTRAHAYAERWLLMHFAQHGAAPSPSTAEEIEIHSHVKIYIDECVALTTVEGAKIFLEKRVAVSNDVYGTADFICWHPANHTLYVRDLKYGAGIPVDVTRNIQLRIYALAALLTMKLPARTVNIGIVQPRYDHPDGAIRSIDFDAVDLMDLYADVLEAVNRVDQAAQAQRTNGWEPTYLKPSEKGCRWCLASPKCPAIKNKAQALAKLAFSAVAEVLPPEATNSAALTKPAYDPLELARTLDFLPILEGWIKNVREFAYGEAEKGKEIPDYKLVEKLAVRKWKDKTSLDDNSPQLVKALGCTPFEIWKPKELIGIGDAEKLAPGKNAKERAAVLEPFVKKESSGHTLVHVSDKREPLRIDAKAAFSVELGLAELMG